ncbi:hypothetical protein PXD04_09660 [Methanosphaera sp. ISO3-F5]|uniref:hypothetical protein n=1 Tax=Methanosphaera sp. ISO3-F5 TaxID=1452353 RepID=UPI002B2610E7|nr:hypothetical protein [Methanosphaera sp. ISO3-F5]WQH63954.1 hypothetical protein PXD04_09660 [Methanosphaera sp. ISO3-F5]
MNNWNFDKLEEMTRSQNEFTKTRLDYVKLAELYEDIVVKTYCNGDVVPLAFKDVEVTYEGKVEDDIILPSIDDETRESIDVKEQERHVMHIKHFSRSISHQSWFDFLDDEVKSFIEKYPEYEEVILE